MERLRGRSPSTRGTTYLPAPRRRLSWRTRSSRKRRLRSIAMQLCQVVRLTQGLLSRESLADERAVCVQRCRRVRRARSLATLREIGAQRRADVRAVLADVGRGRSRVVAHDDVAATDAAGIAGDRRLRRRRFRRIGRRRGIGRDGTGEPHQSRVDGEASPYVLTLTAAGQRARAHAEKLAGSDRLPRHGDADQAANREGRAGSREPEQELPRP
jgi:hypothetical protein